jgi:hypothetical protein
MTKKKSSFLKIRKPALRVTSKGVKLTNIGASLGGKNARINLSRKGVSATVGTPGASLNTRRGCLLSPVTLIEGWLRRRKS